jgi:hypothetical protein
MKITNSRESRMTKHIICNKQKESIRDSSDDSEASLIWSSSAKNPKQYEIKAEIKTDKKTKEIQ